MILLFMLFVANSIALFVISLLLIRNVWCLGANITTIEGWEIERHEMLVRRARKNGGYLDGPDGIRVKITKQEFPYDIGIFQNISQAMGTSFLFWLWPFAVTPSNESGLSFKTNNFEGKYCLFLTEKPWLTLLDSSTSWPPPDPDRMSKKKTDHLEDPSFTSSDHDYIQAFRERQRQDFKRLRQHHTNSLTQRRFHEGYGSTRNPSLAVEGDLPRIINAGGDELAWRDSEGDRLEDFGVDEEVDLYDEDDIPLAELIQRRKASEPTTRFQ